MNHDIIVEREILERRLNQPAYKFYLRPRFAWILTGIVGLVFFLWILIKDNVPSWGWMIFGLSIAGYLEMGRQRERLNALIRLHQINKDEKISEQVVLPYASPVARRLQEPIVAPE